MPYFVGVYSSVHPRGCSQKSGSLFASAEVHIGSATMVICFRNAIVATSPTVMRML